MLEFIGGVVVLIIGYVMLKMVMYRVFPAYGHRVAQRRFMEDPSVENELALWKAESRLRTHHQKNEVPYVPADEAALARTERVLERRRQIEALQKGNDV